MTQILTATAKQAGDEAAKAAIAHYQPLLDAAEREKWTYGIAGGLIALAVVATVDLLKK